MPSPGQVHRTHLNPILKSALACLDLNLDTELRRYRRACRKLGKNLTPPSHSGGISLPQQSLVDLKSITDFIPLAQPREEASPSLPHGSISNYDQVSPSTRVAAQGEREQGNRAPSLATSTLVYQNPKDLTPPPPPTPPTDYLKSSEQLLESLYEQTPSSAPPSPRRSKRQKQNADDYNPVMGNASQQTLAQDIPQESDSKWSEEIFTPLGFSAIALAMASGGLLAWSLLVPPPVSDSQEMVAIEDSVVITPAAVTPVEKPGNLNLGLDLSAPEELVTIDFNNLPNLDPQLPTPVEQSVVLPQELTTTPSNYNASNQGTNDGVTRTEAKPLLTVPTPIAPTPPNLLSALLPPELRPQVEQQPGARVHLPGEGQALYLVVLPYKNEAQLTQVRAIVAQSFIKKLPEGNFIQIAAFDNPKEAQGYGGKLSFQGVKPIVYTLRQ